MTTPKTMQQILDDLTAQYAWETARSMRLLGQVWADLAGPTVARNTRVIKVQQGTIHLAVTTGTWSQELQFMKPDLISRLNSRLSPALTIVDIRTRVSIKAFAPKVRERTHHGERGYYARHGYRSDVTDLGHALEVARDRYREAVKDWLESGYHRCSVCHSPTLIEYTVCSICEKS
jgi:hypothetical protein